MPSLLSFLCGNIHKCKKENKHFGQIKIFWINFICQRRGKSLTVFCQIQGNSLITCKLVFMKLCPAFAFKIHRFFKDISIHEIRNNWFEKLFILLNNPHIIEQAEYQGIFSCPSRPLSIPVCRSDLFVHPLFVQ